MPDKSNTELNSLDKLKSRWSKQLENNFVHFLVDPPKKLLGVYKIAVLLVSFLTCVWSKIWIRELKKRIRHWYIMKNKIWLTFIQWRENKPLVQILPFLSPRAVLVIQKNSLSGLHFRSGFASTKFLKKIIQVQSLQVTWCQFLLQLDPNKIHTHIRWWLLHSWQAKGCLDTSLKNMLLTIDVKTKFKVQHRYLNYSSFHHWSS